MGMNLKDVVEVTKAGYSPADIKQLFALSKNNDEVIALAKEGYKPNEITEFIELANASDVDDEPTGKDVLPEDNNPTGDDVPTGDDKDAKIIELKAKIAEMQKQNVNQSVESHNKTDEDIIDEALKGLLN